MFFKQQGKKKRRPFCYCSKIILALGVILRKGRQVGSTGAGGSYPAGW